MSQDWRVQWKGQSYQIGREAESLSLPGRKVKLRRRRDGRVRLSMDLPIVIEFVDSEDKINSFLPALDEMMKGGLATLEKVRVIHYRANETNAESEKS